MPIGDLLASITGEKTKPSSAPPRTTTAPKRKAEDDAKSPAPKLQRTTSGAGPAPNVNARATGNLVSSIPSNSGSHATPDTTRRPTANGVKGPTSGKLGPSQSQRQQMGSRQGAGLGASSRSLSEGSPAVAKSAPKKGSFAEIMARAAKAQQVMGQVGKIQHKALDKGASKRERVDSKADMARGVRTTGKDHGKSGPTGVPGPRGAISSASGASNSGDRNHVRKRSPGVSSARVTANFKKEQASEAKKPKKAAVATTGYQGTARPPPGAAPKGSSSGPATSGGSTTGESNSRRRLPFGGSRSRNRRHDDYEEDMDDFIDYDEDEPEETEYSGGRYRYASEEDESDMEAGISDIDEEERAAELLGRREDREQEALEQRLKREKEERKRRFLQAAAAKRR